MKLTKQQVKDTSEKAKILVGTVDEEYRQSAFSIVFSKLLSQQTNEIQNIIKKGGESTLHVIKKIKSKQGPKFQLTELVSDGFFKSPKSIPHIINELDKRNHHYKHGDLTRPLESLTHNKILRRDKKKIGNKDIWHYSNW